MDDSRVTVTLYAVGSPDSMPGSKTCTRSERFACGVYCLQCAALSSLAPHRTATKKCGKMARYADRLLSYKATVVSSALSRKLTMWVCLCPPMQSWLGLESEELIRQNIS